MSDAQMSTGDRIAGILWNHIEIIEVPHPGAPPGTVASPVPDIGGVTQAANAIAAEIDGLRAQLAEVATLTLKLANLRLNLKHCSDELDKKTAEVERLRVFADAWFKYVAYANANKQEWASAREALYVAADRARDAAKEQK